MMPSHWMRILWVLGLAVAQDFLETGDNFLAQRGLTLQAVHASGTNLTAQNSWYKTITPFGTTLCIDLPGGDAKNGNKLWLWECNGHDSQIWVFDSNNEIRYGPDESFCIDAADMNEGTQLWLWECNQQQQQSWGFDSSEQKVYLDWTATCLDWYDPPNNGQPLHVWGCNGLATQGWSLWDSGDPGTAPQVFPGDWCQYNTDPGWPAFNTQDELQNDQYWGPYFIKVYGEIPTWGYPICTGAFQFLWRLGAAATGVVQGDPIDCAGGPTGTGQELDSGTFFIGMSFLEAQDAYSYIYNPNLFGASVPDNTWVEVTHTRFPGDLTAIWYYMSVGSGVWLNVGTSGVYSDHADAVSDILGQSCHDHSIDIYGPTPTECEFNFDEMYKEARSRGLNSIQMTEHHDCTCGPEGTSSYKYKRWCPTEIIALDDPSGADYGCSSLLAGGWAASGACGCDESFKSTTKDPGDGIWECQHGCSYANCGSF